MDSKSDKVYSNHVEDVKSMMMLIRSFADMCSTVAIRGGSTDQCFNPQMIKQFKEQCQHNVTLGKVSNKAYESMLSLLGIKNTNIVKKSYAIRDFNGYSVAAQCLSKLTDGSQMRACVDYLRHSDIIQTKVHSIVVDIYDLNRMIAPGVFDKSDLDRLKQQSGNSLPLISESDTLNKSAVALRKIISGVAQDIMHRDPLMCDVFDDLSLFIDNDKIQMLQATKERSLNRMKSLILLIEQAHSNNYSWNLDRSLRLLDNIQFEDEAWIFKAALSYAGIYNPKRQLEAVKSNSSIQMFSKALENFGMRHYCEILQHDRDLRIHFYRIQAGSNAEKSIKTPDGIVNEEYSYTMQLSDIQSKVFNLGVTEQLLAQLGIGKFKIFKQGGINSGGKVEFDKNANVLYRQVNLYPMFKAYIDWIVLLNYLNIADDSDRRRKIVSYSQMIKRVHNIVDANHLESVCGQNSVDKEMINRLINED